MARLIYADNPFAPHSRREVVTVRRRRVRALAPRTRQPVICLLNGRPLLRAGWGYRPRRGDTVLFVALPQGGGGGSNPIGTILMLAVAIFAPVLAGMIPGAGTALITGAAGQVLLTAGQLYTVGIGLAGAALAGALVSPPKSPASLANAKLAAPSPTYSIGAQGNMGRLGAAIPVQYGRVRAFPDFADRPYTRYENNEQWLYLHLNVGWGEFHLSDAKIGNTPFESLPKPVAATTPTLTRPDAWNTDSVPLPSSTTVGPVALCGPEEAIAAVEMDFVAPGGIYRWDSVLSVWLGLDYELLIEYREIDAAGDPIGSWTTAETLADTGVLEQKELLIPWRFEFPAEARYELRVTRQDTEVVELEARHALVIRAARGVIPPDETAVASWEVWTPDLFDECNVYTVGEVSGVDLPSATAVGPYPVCPPGSVVRALEVDLVTPRGLFMVNKDGELRSMSCSVLIEYQQIDDEDNALGAWIEAGTVTIEAATATPQRRTARWDLDSTALGRYQLRATRTDTKDEDSRKAHDVALGAIKSYLHNAEVSAETLWQGQTVIRAKIPATAVQGMQNTMFSVLAIRANLPYWDGAAWWPTRAEGEPPVGYWTTVNWPHEQSQSVVWAAVDALRNSVYGAGVPDEQIDLEGLQAIDDLLAARGDYFNARFDGAETIWDAVQTILRAGRCQPFIQGGKVRVVRDQPATIPACVFTPHQIQAGSLSLTYDLAHAEGFDGVEASYFDYRTGKEATIQASADGSPVSKAVSLSLFGVVYPEQAQREAEFYARVARYRRINISFGVEAEGVALSYGDLIGITHDVPEWGQAALVVAADEGTRVLRLAHELEWTDGATHYLGIRGRNGALVASIAVTQGEGARELALGGSEWPAVLTGASPGAPIYCAFGVGGEVYRLARFRGFEPSGWLSGTVRAVVEHDAVHAV